MDRRKFIKLTATLACGLTSAPSFLWARSNAVDYNPPKYLILIELNGGNDGLNTVIPYRDPLYTQLRPGIALGESEIIPLTEQLALHHALEPLYELWLKDNVAVINGVGYAEPNRSHFRSIEIWDTASDSDEYLDNGWLSRVIPGALNHKDYLADGIVMGRNAAPVSGNNMHTIVMNTIADFTRQARLIEQRKSTTNNPALQHILNIQSDIKYAATTMENKLQTQKVNVPNFKAGPLGRQLQEAAKLIVNHTAAPVMKVSIGSFDTHAAQKGIHQRLLSQFSQGINMFSKVMREQGMWENILLMTYSEFGRRAKQNANQGTDHGTAAPHFMIGGKVKGGMYGEQPSLRDLQDDDLKFKVDYRRLYNTVAKNWWGVSTGIESARFPALDLVI